MLRPAGIKTIINNLIVKRRLVQYFLLDYVVSDVEGDSMIFRFHTKTQGSIQWMTTIKSCIFGLVLFKI